MKKNTRTRNILIPNNSYIKLADEKVAVTSIRISDDATKKKFEVYLINNAEIIHSFKSGTLAVQMYTETEIEEDILEFVNKSKKVLAEIYIPKNCSEETYKKYIEAMFI